MLSVCDDCGRRRWKPTTWRVVMAAVQRMNDPEALAGARLMRRHGASCWRCPCGSFGFAVVRG